jgi:hypothetical protein
MSGKSNAMYSDPRAEDAVFMGWQENILGEIIPLFTITVLGHILDGSTVSESSLRALNLHVPVCPPYKRKG